MKIAIHQPHYFPWVGYFDKIAKVNIFVVLDQVQFEKGSQMIRNKVLDDKGNIRYLTISSDTSNFLNREYRDIKVKKHNPWKENQINAVKNYYRKSVFFDEILSMFEKFMENEYESLFQWTYNSIIEINKILEIPTKLVLQSEVEYDKSQKKSDLVLEIIKALNADTYLSGKGGSIKYLNKNAFKKAGINIELQNFNHPVYSQNGDMKFQSGLSILDMLFQCGIDKTKSVFWENLRKEELEEREYL